MILETERLVLRPWKETDAEYLYKYASHKDVGPIAGWPIHTSVENSLEVIRSVLSKPETYAVVLKKVNHPVGSIGLMIGDASNIGIPDTEGEIGFWIGVPYWGQGLIPEAVREIIKYGFTNLNLDRLWCGYFDGNVKSKRVQEKCGFRYHHTTENVPCAIKGVLRVEHVTCLERKDWEKSNFDANNQGGVSKEKDLSEMSLEELWQLFPISLVPHSDNWKYDYSEIENCLESILYQCPIVRISHIGSTAISNICSKNIVDVLVEVSKDSDIEDTAKVIEKNGFIRMSTEKNRVSFNRGYTKNGFADKVYHLHLRYDGDNDELYFRDYLNDNPQVAKDYEKMKLQLSKQFKYNRDAYTDAKTKFIRKWTAEAKKIYMGKY